MCPTEGQRREMGHAARNQLGRRLCRRAVGLEHEAGHRDAGGRTRPAVPADRFQRQVSCCQDFELEGWTAQQWGTDREGERLGEHLRGARGVVADDVDVIDLPNRAGHQMLADPAINRS